MRSRAASALAFVVICACKADDQVLTPDDEDSGRDGAVLSDAGNPVAASDAAGSMDASDGTDTALGNDAMLGGDATTPSTDGGPVARTAKDPDCDLNGVWIGRQNTVSLALGALQQFANNWYYLEFTQNGEEVTVTEHMDCGLEVQGTVTVRVEPPTMRALIERNRQMGRKGRFAKQPDGTCTFSMEKFWSVRGVNEEMFAPKPRNLETSIEQIQQEMPLPTKENPNGAEDWDADGNLGVAWVVSNLGKRHSGQRDWTRWFSDQDHRVTAARDFTSDLFVRADFSNEEFVYAADNFTLDQTSVPDGSAAHSLTLHFLGRTRDDARAKAILKSDKFETCLAIQAALPPVKGLK